MPNSAHPFQSIRQHSNKSVVLVRLMDIVVIAFTLWAVLTWAGVDWDNKHTWWLLISIVSFGSFASFNELYRRSRSSSSLTEVRLVAFTWFCVFLALILADEIVSLFFADKLISLIDPIYKDLFFAWNTFVPVEIISWHIIFWNVRSWVKKMGKRHHRVAIVGATMLGSELEKIFFEEEKGEIEFLGFFDDRSGDEKVSIDDDKRKRGQDSNFVFDRSKIVGNTEDLINLATKGGVDVVYIALPLRAENHIKVIIEDLSNSTVSVHFVPDLFVFDMLSASVTNIKGIPVVSIIDTPFNGVDGALKRIFDIVFSSCVLVAIFFPLLIIALAIRLTSPGSVLFKQRRYGFRGEEIIVWKFRSMSVSEDAEKVVQAKKNDPRVTKLGAFLRRTSLDELPQFFNVLQGRMSVVGPRPHAVAHNEFYRGEVHGYMRRHKVKPGITGLAQVNGYRGETDTLEKMEGRLRYDLSYIRNWSLWLDIKIVLLTIAKGFVGSKAY